MPELLWFLLPLAFASGWFVALRGARNSAGDDGKESLRSDYFKGLNYLLNDKPDKAIEVFIRVLEVDSETVETHLALGNLYRRSGEVDRAIRIHQNLMARETLNESQRSSALFELGLDYMSAGLFDRAEDLFLQLTRSDVHEAAAFRQLVDVYEREKDWDKAIESARELGAADGENVTAIIAQYYCEKAELARQAGKLDEALRLVREALGIDRACVRGSLLEGEVLLASGEHESAMRAFQRVESQDPDYVSEAVPHIATCCRELGRTDALEGHLSHLIDRYGVVSATLALSELKRSRQGAAAAAEFLSRQLQRRPSVRGLERLLELELSHSRNGTREDLLILRVLATKLLEQRPVYKCNRCGFPAMLLHWQCPGCKHWNTIKPIQGMEGE